MSKHEYKFGDRVMYDGMSGWVPAVVTGTIGSDSYWVNREDGGSARACGKDLTPGWPVPDGCVRVRAAVRVTNRGAASVRGVELVSGTNDDRLAMLTRFGHNCEAEAVHFIEADIQLPKTETFRAEVVS